MYKACIDLYLFLLTYNMTPSLHIEGGFIFWSASMEPNVVIILSELIQFNSLN